MSKILIVEDDHNLGLMIQDILEFKGYEVILSKKPEETTENIRSNQIDLVLLDKLISGVDGTDVCIEIRQTEAVATTPVLMMSALNNARKVCIDAGASDFISKPFEMDDLLAKVEQVIQ